MINVDAVPFGAGIVAILFGWIAEDAWLDRYTEEMAKYSHLTEVKLKSTGAWVADVAQAVPSAFLTAVGVVIAFRETHLLSAAILSLVAVLLFVAIVMRRLGTPKMHTFLKTRLFNLSLACWLLLIANVIGLVTTWHGGPIGDASAPHPPTPVPTSTATR